jgi:cell division protein FtsL
MVADFGKKQKSEHPETKIAFQATGIFLAIIIGLLIFGNIKIYQKKRELASQVNNYKQQIEEINKSNQNLKNEIANADNVDYLEKIAYEQLGQQRPGEKEIIFVQSPKKPEPVVQTNNFWETKTWTSWLSGALQWIKTKF